jgi:MFS family permease
MSTDSPLRAWETVVLYLVLAAATLFPLLTVDFPPLADLPNHLARAHIMGDLGTNPDLARHYSVDWQLLSFQSSDLILPWLVKWVGVETAARLFIIATFATMIGGVLALHKVLFGRIGPWPALAFLLLYNFMFGWGLLSYLFTMGLALILLADWIDSAPREGVLRTVGFSLGALALFFLHFLAFAVFALAVATFEAWRWWHDRKSLIRRLILTGAVFVIPGVLFLLAPRPTIPMLNYYGESADKVRAALAPFNMYFGWQDLALEFFAFLLIVIGILKRLFPIATPIRWTLIAVGVAMLLMPNQLMSVWGSDFRLPTVFLLLLIAGTELPWKKRWQAAAFAGIVVIMLLIRVGLLTLDWRGMDADITELRTALTVVDRGSKVVVVQANYDERDHPATNLYPYRHFGAFAVLDRDVFLPHLFSAATPLRFISPGGRWITGQLAVLQNPEWRPNETAASTDDYKTKMAVRKVTEQIQEYDLATSTVDWSDWPEQFDYLIDFDYGQPGNPVPGLLIELHRGSYFTIFRIQHPVR